MEIEGFNPEVAREQERFEKALQVAQEIAEQKKIEADAQE